MVNGRDIAVIGLHGRFPKASNTSMYWQNLCKARNCIEKIPADRWQDTPEQKFPGGWGAFLENVEKFDPAPFGIPPKVAREMDPQLRLFLESVWNTMEDAGYGNRYLRAKKQIGLYVGVMWHDYALYAHEFGYMQNRYLGAGSLSWEIANRTSFIMDFTGPSIALDTACSSSLSAIHLACLSLTNGECDMAVAGGVNLHLHPGKLLYLQEEGLLRIGGENLCFAGDQQGYIPGEGVGSILLKPLDKAKNDGDHIYGIIKASASNHVGKGMFFKVPDAESQAQLMLATLQQAGVRPDTIGYVEMAAYGAELTDQIEFRALQKVFKDCRRKHLCSLGSVKSNIGHLEAASGMAQIIKVLLQLKYKQLAPSLFADQIAPEIDLAQSPFYLQRELTPWPAGKNKSPRRASINSFGAGGANVHLLIEECPQVIPERPSRQGKTETADFIGA